MNVSRGQRSGKPLRLYVNVDHVATVRQARRTDEPDPVAAALAAESAGADGITVHLREDRRHVQDDDVRRLTAAATTVVNLELATAPAIVALAEELRPHQVTFVPERREEITTEGGLDLAHDDRALRAAIEHLAGCGLRVSLFVDPDHATLDRAAALGVPAVELHTGAFAHAWPTPHVEVARLTAAARHARELGLAVHAGHGLTYRNVHLVAALTDIEELNIGHSIVSRAVMDGMTMAVRAMRALMDAAR
ncbi:MAG: pyridoxine 5'-phosphate synthase [Gemmatimonadales bacterium]